MNPMAHQRLRVDTHTDTDTDTSARSRHSRLSSCFSGGAAVASSAAGAFKALGSPDRIRSPCAWLTELGWTSHHHHRKIIGGGRRRHHSADFHYDALSYALNFDEGNAAAAEERAAGSNPEFLKYRNFSARLPASPPAAAGHPLERP